MGVAGNPLGKAWENRDFMGFHQDNIWFSEISYIYIYIFIILYYIILYYINYIIINYIILYYIILYYILYIYYISIGEIVWNYVDLLKSGEIKSRPMAGSRAPVPCLHMAMMLMFWTNRFSWLVIWNIIFLTFHILGINIPTYPNWRTHIFQRGRYTTNQSWLEPGLVKNWPDNGNSVLNICGWSTIATPEKSFQKWNWEDFLDDDSNIGNVCEVLGNNMMGNIGRYILMINIWKYEPLKIP